MGVKNEIVCDKFQTTERGSCFMFCYMKLSENEKERAFIQFFDHVD